MIEERNTDEFSGLAKSRGERPILRARRGIPGRMIVGSDEGMSIQEDGRLEHFARMHNAECE